jgi:hypothetical protein
MKHKTWSGRLKKLAEQTTQGIQLKSGFWVTWSCYRGSLELKCVLCVYCLVLVTVVVFYQSESSTLVCVSGDDSTGPFLRPKLRD